MAAHSDPTDENLYRTGTTQPGDVIHLGGNETNCDGRAMRDLTAQSPKEVYQKRLNGHAVCEKCFRPAS